MKGKQYDFISSTVTSSEFAALLLECKQLNTLHSDLEFLRLESWSDSRDISMLNFESLGLGLGLDA